MICMTVVGRSRSFSCDRAWLTVWAVRYLAVCLTTGDPGGCGFSPNLAHRGGIVQTAEEPDYHCKLGTQSTAPTSSFFVFFFVRPSGLAPLCNVFVAATNSSRRAFSSVAGGATLGGSGGREERVSLEVSTPRAVSGRRSHV